MPHWLADSLGLSLKDAVGGLWIEGEALELVWRIVNGNPWGPVVQEGNDFYQLSLRIPDVSMMAPPTPQP